MIPTPRFAALALIPKLRVEDPTEVKLKRKK
jgi:hypothetical protein